MGRPSHHAMRVGTARAAECTRHARTGSRYCAVVCPSDRLAATTTGGHRAHWLRCRTSRKEKTTFPLATQYRAADPSRAARGTSGACTWRCSTSVQRGWGGSGRQRTVPRADTAESWGRPQQRPQLARRGVEVGRDKHGCSHTAGRTPGSRGSTTKRGHHSGASTGTPTTHRATTHEEARAHGSRLHKGTHRGGLLRAQVPHQSCQCAVHRLGTRSPRRPHGVHKRPRGALRSTTCRRVRRKVFFNDTHRKGGQAFGHGVTRGAGGVVRYPQAQQRPLQRLTRGAAGPPTCTGRCGCALRTCGRREPRGASWVMRNRRRRCGHRRR